MRCLTLSPSAGGECTRRLGEARSKGTLKVWLRLPAWITRCMRSGWRPALWIADMTCPFLNRLCIIESLAFIAAPQRVSRCHSSEPT